MAEAKTAGFGAIGRAGNGLRRADTLFAIAMMGIIFLLIFPIPTWLLDFLLAISLTLAVLILMTVLLIDKPLDLSSFPTILLISAILRLALNIASTRLILSHGHQGTSAAGHVIEAFGNFVMAGSVVIGAIVFMILTIINFVVITKGSGRIAEVSARFSLDAMPGKQMAIDADLSAGLIDEETARRRRKELEDESSFFGSMDGANKFVRGDAIAGLLITFINFIGGIIIGVVQKDLEFADALKTYTVLTIGDGLVSQVPALIVSTGAGLLVSKSGVSGSADKAVLGQLSRFPQAMGLSSGIMMFMALLPGVPGIPFGILSGMTGYLAWNLMKSGKKTDDAAKAKEQEKTKAETAKPKEENMAETLHIDGIRLELGYGLLPLINYHKGHRLTEQIKALRKQLAREIGFVMPAVRIQDNMQLPPNTYVVKVKDIECGRGDIKPDMLLVMNPSGGKISLPGEDTKEPTFGLPALWVSESYREEALFKNYTVVDPPTVITTHLTETVKDNMADLLTYAETQKLISELGSEHEKMAAEVVPGQISVNGLKAVLQNLLAEKVSIRDLPTILEAVSEVAQSTKNTVAITEHVRMRMARQICHANAGDNGYIPVATLAPKWEQAFSESLIGGGDDRQLAMAPSMLQDFISAVRKAYDGFALKGEIPVILTSPQIRPFVRTVIERFRGSTVVMSQNEIYPKAKIKTIGQV